MAAALVLWHTLQRQAFSHQSRWAAMGMAALSLPTMQNLLPYYDPYVCMGKVRKSSTMFALA
jgi:hypothetical protein